MAKISRTKLEVHGDYLLVEPLSTEEHTASGLVRGEQYEDKPYKGIVKHAGIDRELEGKVVYFNKYAPFPLNVGSENYLVVKSEDIIAHEV